MVHVYCFYCQYQHVHCNNNNKILIGRVTTKRGQQEVLGTSLQFLLFILFLPLSCSYNLTLTHADRRGLKINNANKLSCLPEPVLRGAPAPSLPNGSVFNYKKKNQKLIFFKHFCISFTSHSKVSQPHEGEPVSVVFSINIFLTVRNLNQCNSKQISIF